MNVPVSEQVAQATGLQSAYREVGFGVLAGNPASRDSGGATFVTEFGFIDRAGRTSSGRSRSTTARRAAANARERRANARKTRARTRARRARARRSRAARARAALAPGVRRGRLVGSVAVVRGSIR